MAKSTPKKKAAAPAATPAVERALAVPSVLVPNTLTSSVVLEFSLTEEGQLRVDTHAVVAWQVSSMVEPITVSPPVGLRCLVEALGSVMSYTFLDNGEEPPLRFDTLTAATAHARAALGGL